MATYYNNNNINSQTQGEASQGLQTLILMNQTTPYQSNHIGSFSDTGQSHHHNNNNNLVFLNTVTPSLTPRALPHAPIQHQHLLGIPLDPNHPSHREIHYNMPRVHYNMYTQDPPTEACETTRAQQGGFSSSLSKVSTSSPGSTSSHRGMLGSCYLKATQELLDEVVSVGKEVIRGEYKVVGEGRNDDAGGETSQKGEEREISTTERQEIRMRKAKLVDMLNEVEQRYRQYHHQMQIIISWFEQATGTGSAKTYTALALQTVSKQFRCLKDAILSQIRASSKSLEEEDSLGVGKSEGSKLKFVDHHIRQQRALQQLGMIQPNAWRPQRGLPERSVSVLRAWLFEHFLHPYPKDSDKIMLAKQTGLTRSQVSNWFINARVRLWKPMVEKMYLEELKEQEHVSDDKTTKGENNNNDLASKINTHLEKTPVIENENINFKSILEMPTNKNSPRLIRSPEMENIAHSSPKKQREADFFQSPNSYLSNEQISMKFDDERQNRESFTLMGGPTNFIEGFGRYPISEIGRFGAEQFPTTYSGNGVALTLGLSHCENLSQSFLQNQNIQMGTRLKIGETDEFGTINTLNASHSSVSYEDIDIQNRKRFAAQLLPDFMT